MGYFDNMRVMLGKGMNAADRKTQELRLQAELGRIDLSLESAYAALGKVAYSHPSLATQIRQECPGEYNAVTSLLQDEQSLRGRIEDLQRQAMTAVPVSGPMRQFLCMKCGTPVTLDIAYCPTCGDNLSELKAQYRLCPNCNTYHTSDSMFCIQCGSQTVEVPVAQAIKNNATADSANSDEVPAEGPIVQNEAQPFVSSTSNSIAESNALTVEEAGQAPAMLTCPNCGTPVASDDVFCGECGKRLID